MGRDILPNSNLDHTQARGYGYYCCALCFSGHEELAGTGMTTVIAFEGHVQAQPLFFVDTRDCSILGWWHLEILVNTCWRSRYTVDTCSVRENFFQIV